MGPPAQRHKLAQRLPPGTITHLLADYQAGDSTAALAEQYRIGFTSVKMLLHRHDIPLRHGRRLSDREVLAATELYQAGWSLAKLGQKFDVDGSTVWRRLRRAGVVMRSPSERSIKRLIST